MQAYFKGGMSRFNSKGVFFLQQGVVIEGQHFSGNLKKTRTQRHKFGEKVSGLSQIHYLKSFVNQVNIHLTNI